MFFSEIKRMEPYKRGGRLRVILKLSLPQAVAGEGEDGTAADEVNIFYGTLLSDYVQTLSELELSENGTVPLTVRVTWLDESDEKYIRICRTTEILQNGKRLSSNESLDCFSRDTGLCVKPPKGPKKRLRKPNSGKALE